MNPGDIVYHKATEEKCVIAAGLSMERVKVTTEHGKSEVYYKAELLTEAEYKEKNKNEI